MRTRTVTAIVLVAALAGCGACDQPPSDALEDCSASVVLPGSVKTDILFVIDDSGSMGGEQQQMRFALGRFISRLASSPIANQFQIGVTNTSVAEFLRSDGTQPADFEQYAAGTPSAGIPYPDGALVSVDPAGVVSGNETTYGKFFFNSPAPTPGFFGTQILTWDSPTLEADFTNNVLVGVVGSSREQPFEAARLALSDRLAGENAGFLRPGARLAIIFLTDEDDCSGPRDATINGDIDCLNARTNAESSLVKVSDMAAFLQAPIAGELRDVVVAAIANVTCSGGVCGGPRCGTNGSTPDRIVALLSALPPARTRLASICDPTFDQALDSFADAILSQTLPLDGAVADHRMLAVNVTKADGTQIACPVIGDAEPLTSTVGAFYEPPRSGRPPSLTFLNGCALDQGDSVSVNVICIR